MPRFDGTGPEGKGPRTGRGLGRCDGAAAQGAPPRRGVGLGRGRGFGRGQGFAANPAGPANTKEELKQKLEDLKAQQRELEQRLNESD